MWQLRGDRPRDRGDLALKKERNSSKTCVIMQRAALMLDSFHKVPKSQRLKALKIQRFRLPHCRCRFTPRPQGTPENIRFLGVLRQQGTK